MNELTVLVTGCGAPGTVGTLWSLRRNYDDRPVRVVGVDMKSNQIGRFACDAFHHVPVATDEGFVESLVDICATEEVDVVLPQVTAELSILASERRAFNTVGSTVAVSDSDSIRIANSKQQLIEHCKRCGVPTPRTIDVGSEKELDTAAIELGYPDVPFIVKPPVSNGQRGFRVIRNDWDQKAEFYERKPSGTKMTLEQLHDTLGETFPRLLAMEFLPGEEYTIDVFRTGNQSIVVPRSRDTIRSGISFRATTTADSELIEYVEELSESLDLQYAFGFQFKRAADGTPKILECNPRVQGTMVTSTLANANVVYSAIKAAVGEAATIPPMVPTWGLSFYRYWGGIGVHRDEIVDNIGDSV